jgi:hypothetical protein
LGAQDAALAATRTLAERVARLSPRPRCAAARVEAGKLYYQCVYVRMEDDDALSAAHTLARDAFASAGSAGPSFMPHASVIYGDLLEDDKAARVQQARAACGACQARRHAHSDASHCVFQVADELAPLISSGEAAFEVSALALWRTQAGRTTEWTEVAVVPLP